MFETVLVANRGEIARRIIRTVQRMGLRAVAVHSEADVKLPYVREADEAVAIGPAPPAQSYRDVEALLEAARQTGAAGGAPRVRLPGRGRRVRPAGAEGGAGLGRPVAGGDRGDGRQDPGPQPGRGSRRARVARHDASRWATSRRPCRSAHDIGYPVMVKASAGGGGMGMAVADDEARPAGRARAGARLRRSGCSATRRCCWSGSSPGSGTSRCRSSGSPTAGWSRWASATARSSGGNQKVAEETPSPAVTPELRERMFAAAVRAAEAVGYRNAGTVECLLDADSGEFVFLEMNTRLQVEHPITEMVTGIDLVEQQLLVAAGEPPTFDPDAVPPTGPRDRAAGQRRGPGAVPARPGHHHRLGGAVRAGRPGRLRLHRGQHRHAALRLADGQARGARRRPRQALARARAAVAGFRVEGPKCNLPFFAELLDAPGVRLRRLRHRHRRADARA